MRILVLNGSPKRERCDTLHITRAFLEGMKEEGGEAQGCAQGPGRQRCRVVLGSQSCRPGSRILGWVPPNESLNFWYLNSITRAEGGCCL